MELFIIMGFSIVMGLSIVMLLVKNLMEEAQQGSRMLNPFYSCKSSCTKSGPPCKGMESGLWGIGRLLLSKDGPSGTYICAGETLTELQIVTAWALCFFYDEVHINF